MGSQVSEKAQGCCDCTCYSICKAPYWRAFFAAYGCDPDISQCTVSEVASGTFTEENPASIPGELPCGGLPIRRYWKATINMACANPTSFDIEIACCNVGNLNENGGEMNMRINGVHWFGFTDGGCMRYWSAYSAGNIEVGTQPGCCGVFAIQVFCADADPGIPNPPCDFTNMRV